MLVADEMDVRWTLVVRAEPALGGVWWHIVTHDANSKEINNGAYTSAVVCQAVALWSGRLDVNADHG